MTEDRDINEAYSEVKDCDDLDEFWECLSPIGDFFKTPTGNSKFIYRGQSDSRWLLVPKVCREDQMGRYKIGIMRGLTQYPDHVFFEWLLLTQFVQLCDSRGLTIPYDSPELRLELRTDFFGDQYGKHTARWPSKNIIPLMALAQHHGIPTCLLDWTRNPYIACYFAAASAVANGSNSDRALERMAVFGLDLFSVPDFHDNIDGINGRLQHVRAPGSATLNLPAQEGSFILVPNHGSRLDTFTWDVSLEKVITNEPAYRSSISLKKVTLPRSLAYKLLERCSQFGVSAASLFPGYDGAARATFENLLVFHTLQEQRANNHE